MPLVTKVVNPASASDSDDSSLLPQPEIDTSSGTEDDFESIDEEGKNDCNCVKQFEQTYDDGNMFAPTELEDF